MKDNSRKIVIMGGSFNPPTLAMTVHVLTRLRHDC